jgi:simple sugar transport system substrate-binding protein
MRTICADHGGGRTKALRRLAAELAAATLVLTGCTGDAQTPSGGPPSGGESSKRRFAVITHGSAGDAFWDVVKKGAEQARQDLGATVSYQGSGKADEQANLINAAIVDKVDGLVVSMANPDALAEPIKRAVAQGIPVVTINSGQAKSASFGALAHVGQDETVAGQGAGAKLREVGVKKLLCVIHEAGNIGLEQRCAGARQTLGGEVIHLQVNISNVAEAQNTVASRLQADKAIDGVLALNPAIGVAAVDAVARADAPAKVATFDLSGDVVDAVAAGKILFAIDQQQYLQGYLPIVMLSLYVTNANTVGGGKPVLTGPGYVTRDNAATIKHLASKGTR